LLAFLFFSGDLVMDGGNALRSWSGHFRVLHIGSQRLIDWLLLMKKKVFKLLNCGYFLDLVNNSGDDDNVL
jgi:hypothetical protein